MSTENRATTKSKKLSWSSIREQLELSSADTTFPITAVLLLGVLALQLLMVAAYVGALHAPKPRNVPIAVVGPSIEVAPVMAKLRVGGVLAPRNVPDLPSAKRAVDQREVYAVLTPGRSGDQLLVVPAASSSVAEFLPPALRKMEPAGRKLNVQTYRALPSNDPRGLSAFYLIVGWLVGGYIAATILGLARGGVPRNVRSATSRLLVLAGYALLSGLLGALVVQSIIGALDGSFLALASIGALVVFATAAATSALQALFGVAGTALAILLFVALGNPASGGPLAPELLMPGPLREIGAFLPPGAGTTLIRNVTYFDGNAIARALTVLGAYALVGSLLTVVAGLRRGKRRPDAIGKPEVADSTVRA